MSTILNQVLNAQASGQGGAGPYERSEDRQNYRNGSRERRLNTMIGKLRLAGASGEKAFSGSGLAALPGALAVLSLPLSIGRRLRTINGLERSNEEPRRRERVIGIFPNEQSVDRMMAALLMETNEEPLTGRVYLNLTEYLAQKAQRADKKKNLSAAP